MGMVSPQCSYCECVHVCACVCVCLCCVFGGRVGFMNNDSLHKTEGIVQTVWLYHVAHNKKQSQKLNKRHLKAIMSIHSPTQDLHTIYLK